MKSRTSVIPVTFPGNKNPFDLDTYHYQLPPELIAQNPLQNRLDSRLMVIHRRENSVQHSSFRDLGQFLRAGDLLIFNDTRVIPARLFGKRATGGEIEALLLEESPSRIWKALIRPARKIKVGDRLFFPEGCATVTSSGEDGERELKFDPPLTREALQRIGEIPLPPYIHETLSDMERYQTIYAKEEGAVAAPTAGLHFTPEFLNDLKQKGIKTSFVTLHVGAGTFKPVSAQDIREHPMHEERFHIPRETVAAINHTRSMGGRVIAVGTTSARTLEAALVEEDGRFLERDYQGRTKIFIYPGYQFKVLDGLLTNFHLPESTLLMMVSAFAGLELARKAYQMAIKEKYRFFSFGDAMLIL